MSGITISMSTLNARSVVYAQDVKRLLAASAAFVALAANPTHAATSLEPVLAVKTRIDGHPTAASLRGKVVRIDVFTFGCINGTDITPNLRHLHETADLAIVGIHTPRCGGRSHDRCAYRRAITAQEHIRRRERMAARCV